MDLQPTDFLSGLGGLANLPHPYDDGQQVINDQQRNQAGEQQLALGAAKLSALAQQKQQAQQYQADVQTALANPSPKNFASLIAKYPEQHEALKQAWDAQDEPTKQTNLTQLGNVFAYLSNGKPDLAAKSIQARIDAERAAGLDTSDDERVLALISSGKPEDLTAAKGMAGYHLAAVLGPDKFGESLKTLGLSTGDEGSAVINPGGALVNKRTGAVLYQSDATPKVMTVRNADGSETVVRVPTEGGGQASGGGSPSGSGGAPLSVQLKNPGAIRFDPSNQWQGQVGQKDGFVVFDTVENGARAHRKLIANQIKDGYDTPLAWAQHYAPASDGNDPQSYAARIAAGLGIGVNDKIPTSAVPKMAAISAAVESGGTPAPQSQVAGGGAQELFRSQGGKPGYALLSPAEKSAIPGLDPNTVYQRGPDGQITAVGGQSRSQLKPWPTVALGQRQTSIAALKNLEPAFALLDPNNKSKEAKVAQNALGIGNNLPNRYINWSDPNGTDFRARIGQIGGIIIKDTSGAAVSLSEDARLGKWVPQVTDSPATARAKLGNLIRELRLRNQALDETYTEDQGFRPFHASGAAASGPAVQIKSAAEWSKLPKGTPYVDPKGVRRVKS